MRRGLQGTLRLQDTPPERFRAFLPAALPPVPPLQRTTEIQLALSRADQMVGRLDGISRLLPSVDLLLFFYTRKEAVLSSQIEGTQTTLSEYLLFELDVASAPNPDDVQEVSNYVSAMQHGLRRLRENFPLSLRLLREMHAILLRTGRGTEKQPGEFRTSQNWIGGRRPGDAKYVPPPAPERRDALDLLEKFLHGEATQFPVLIQAALLHVQFETIHPFLDGNGRLGRLLITLLLVERGVLRKPLLYLSLYLKQAREEYFEHLQRVRMDGTWEEWVLFFLQAVAVTAERAVQLAHDLLELKERDLRRVRDLGARAGTTIRVFEQACRTPYLTARAVSEATEVSFPPAASALEKLESLGILAEITGRSRGRVYVYREYVDLLSRGGEE